MAAGRSTSANINLIWQTGEQCRHLPRQNNSLLHASSFRRCHWTLLRPSVGDLIKEQMCELDEVGSQYGSTEGHLHVDSAVSKCKCKHKHSQLQVDSAVLSGQRWPCISPVLNSCSAVTYACYMSEKLFLSGVRPLGGMR